MKGNYIIVELSHSVKVREGYGKSYVKLYETDDLIAVREGP